MTAPQPDPPSARWTADQLRDITAHLFSGGKPAPEPAPAEDEEARRLKGNHVPREGANPRMPQPEETAAAEYVRALFDPYGPANRP